MNYHRAFRSILMFLTDKKSVIAVLVVASFLCMSTKNTVIYAGHLGEQKMLDVDISFSGQYGHTITSAQGIDYYFWGMVFHEDKVYPQQYWGDFPLYFFDVLIPITVTVTNNGPREMDRVSVQTESFVLRTDGSNGFQLAPLSTIDADIRRGETKTINASFIAHYSPEADSGLDRFEVKVLHQNQGQGSTGNPTPSLIMVKEGIFCPPKYIKK